MNHTQLERAAEFVARHLSQAPRVFIVLGSGLSGLAARVEDAKEVHYADLPGFPPPGVAGHQGRFVGGTLEGVPVLLQAGRYHFYEGHEPSLVVAPVRLASILGVQAAFFTNAAGGLREDLPPGSLMLLRDHLNLQGRNPLVGAVEPGEARFPDMTEAYDRRLRGVAVEVAKKAGIPLKEGVYAAVLGPSYETPAEIQMLRTLGADVVGMSTVPEVVTARTRGLRVLACSVVTNWAAGISGQPLAHQEVLDEGRKATAALEALVRGVLREGFVAPKQQ
ncbi:MAG: purine-nucleoside phosphorylase [Gemmatimonadota bacterium]